MVGIYDIARAVFGDHDEKLGEGDLSIDFSESEKEESSISNTSCFGSESFDLGIERFDRSAGASVVKEV